MPRRRQPLSLRSSSLRVLAKLAVDSCKKSDGNQEEEIRQYVQDIPNTFANEYVHEVLQLHSRRISDCDITSAFHPKCTEISRKGADKFFTNPEQFLCSLHVMSGLIHIEPVLDFEHFCIGQWLDFPFPKMANLQSINICSGINPSNLSNVIENCPQLEGIEIYFYSCDDAMPLSKCKHLKRITVGSMTPEVAVHLLDHLPNLEVLLIGSDCILEVLPLCTRAYKLKDFVADLDANDAASVQNLVAHFPHLENLTMDGVDNEHVNLISELDHLKSLTLISGTSSNLLFLMDKCMFGLHKLVLQNITGLDSLFKQNVNVSYPNLESLSISECTGINLAGIGEIFPNLKSLELWHGEYMAHSLPFKMPHAGFQALEELVIFEVPVPQVRYLIPFCSRLKSLLVHNNSVKSCLYEFLCNANMKELRILRVWDNDMKMNVIPIILDLCGEYLESVELNCSEPILSPNYCHELSSQIQQYDMHFCISGEFRYEPDNTDLNDD